ncbi:unnamed protein product [marine sediment metagenome]|uniref:Uncharacterized protein n=1 Tax=marine sediment metagenome TaxID=412755 RepID=X1RTW0_9ZZZZ
MSDGDKLKEVLDEYEKARQKAAERISKEIEADRQARQARTEEQARRL